MAPSQSVTFRCYMLFKIWAVLENNHSGLFFIRVPAGKLTESLQILHRCAGETAGPTYNLLGTGAGLSGISWGSPGHADLAASGCLAGWTNRYRWCRGRLLRDNRRNWHPGLGGIGYGGGRTRIDRRGGGGIEC